jgi:plastocyanin
MRRFATALSLVATLALVLGACASSKDTGLPAGPTTAPPGTVCTGTVDMTDALKFVPEKCTVKVDTTVMWKNAGTSLPHTVTAEDPKIFDSGDTAHPIAPGGEFKFTFKTTGEFPYFCRLHAAQGVRSGMIGTIVVVAN